IPFGSNDNDESKARLIEIASRKRTHDFRNLDCRVTHVSYSHDGRFIVTGNVDGMIRFLNAKNGEFEKSIDLECDGERSHIYQHAWFTLSPNGRFVAASKREEVLIYEIQTGQKTLTIKGNAKWIASVAFSPDNML